MYELRKSIYRQWRLFTVLAVVVVVLAAAMIVFSPNKSVPQAFLDVTKTQEALHLTATYYGQFPRPHPSMTYPGDCYMGSATACAADEMREFDTDYRWFQLYAGTSAAETVTAEALITATP